ncbi:hypothetical protein NUW54_g13726 [Trametes sanguinea]|uniref:Uncharacterized protein n=1 Tax=Trametes sanguinea TaxID=158606 RepID=A0ACC1MIH2_9APHY|nr:hypothetical protein NUW54_g13726 [Trametes sanguinea]
MASDDGYVYVDDADPRIVVSDNWGVSSISYAYDGTLHGASVADATATFTFTGQEQWLVHSRPLVANCMYEQALLSP